MMNNVLLTFSMFFLSILNIQANDLTEGYAVVEADTIYGEIKINFEAGSILVKQEGINKMFLSGIESVTILNETRDTYYTYMIDGKDQFYKALVTGTKPLVEKEGITYCIVDDYPTVIEEKTLSLLFGKKDVKDYIFVRNLSIDSKEDLMDIFMHFNNSFDR